jgi:hypothetical protein
MTSHPGPIAQDEVFGDVDQRGDGCFTDTTMRVRFRRGLGIHMWDGPTAIESIDDTAQR